MKTWKLHLRLSPSRQLEYQANKMAAAHAEPLTSMNVGID